MTTKAILRTDLADFSTRTDLTSAQLDTLIVIAEAQIARNVRVQDMESFTTLVVDTDGEGALPSDYLQLRSVTIADAGTYANTPKIVYAPPNVFHEKDAANAAYTSSNDDTFYTIQDRVLRLTPKPSANLTLNVGYYTRYAALSADGDTNWLLTNHYDVYLYAGLMALHGFMMDDEQETRWFEKFKIAVNQLHDSELRGQRAPVKRRIVDDSGIA